MIFFTRKSAALILAAALSLTAVAEAGTLNSNLQIEAGHTFELGGGQPAGFTVTGTNTGPVGVAVLGQREGKAAEVRGTVAPGGKVEANFAAGEMALLRNTSDSRMARLTLKITGDTLSLGMTYSANPQR
ncbi:MAG: hypothetical protein ACKO1N_02935 [Erythrobacter sp.]